MNTEITALQAVNHVPAMIAHWDRNQICTFANDAYRAWYGRNPEDMVGISLEELVGPNYGQNLPYILEALGGKKQVFERQYSLPGNVRKDMVVTYTPHVVAGETHGFWAHVADVTILREREAELERARKEKDAALAEVWTLTSLLPMCSGCKSIRNTKGEWFVLEEYISQRDGVDVSHGMCPQCIAKYYPELDLSRPKSATIADFR